jgi:hypothetical protein
MDRLRVNIALGCLFFYFDILLAFFIFFRLLFIIVFINLKTNKLCRYNAIRVNSTYV